jgi:hypothetical protein
MSEFASGENISAKSVESLKILCIMPEAQVKSLQWIFNSHNISDKKIELFLSRLSEAEERIKECDLFLLAMDLGQPVPHSHLKGLWGRPGLVSLIQPTPLQLLELGKYPLMLPFAWDGSNFNDLASKLIQTVEQLESWLKRSQFQESSLFWLETKIDKPRFVRWLNIPERWPAPELYYLDSSRALFSVGCANSGADLCIPEAGSQELIYFQRQHEQWYPKILSQTLAIGFSQAPESPITPGVTFKIKDYEFEILSDPELLPLFQQAKSLGLTKKEWTKTIDYNDQPPEFLDVIKKFLLSGETGELVARDGVHKGVLILENGILQQAICGSIFGEKALQRIFLWERVQWSWNPSKIENDLGSELHYDYFKLRKLVNEWRLRWSRVHTVIPPMQLKIKVVAQVLPKKTQWNYDEVQLLASIAEFSNVHEIMNRCPLRDLEVIEGMIKLRKEGLLEIER